MRTKTKSLISISLISLATLVLGGCATSKQDLFPHDENKTMMDVWKQSGSSQQALLDARSVLRRSIDGVVDIQSAYSRDAVNEIRSQFRRLPNPDLVMYIYPHLAGTDPIPVPGYSTIFPLYTKVQYALPGERVEDY